MKRYVVGDIHGRAEELKRILKDASFDYDEDMLISVGDIVDRGPKPFECMFELQKIKNFIGVKGNHDVALYDWIKNNCRFHYFGANHGAGITMLEFKYLDSEEIAQVENFLAMQKDYYVDEHNNLFVHAGFDADLPIDNQYPEALFWQREFFKYDVIPYYKHHTKTSVRSKEGFNEVFIGHTPTATYELVEDAFVKCSDPVKNGIKTPIHCLNVWNMDTGAGFVGGNLSLMNIDTKELFQVKIK